MRNPFDRFSARTIRAIYGVAAFVVFVVSALNFHQVMYVRPTGNDQCRWTLVAKDTSRLLITEVVRGGVSEVAGIRNGDFLLAINGKSFQSDRKAQLLINEAAGTSVRYTVERDGRVFDTDVLILKAINMSYLAFALQGFSLFVIGLIVVMARPQGRIQRMFARYGMLSCLFLANTQGNYDSALDPVWRYTTFGAAFVLAGVFGPPSFVRFFLYFPVRHRYADKKWLTAFLFILSAILTGLIVAGPKQISQPWLNGIFFSRFGFILAGFAFFVVSYYRLVRPDRRHSLRPVLVGVSLGIAAVIYMMAVAAINPFAAFINPVILLPALLLPAAAILMGYAIIRYRLMDIDLIVKRGLVYGLVTASVAAIYIVTVYGIGSLLSSLLGEQENRLVTILALVVVAFAFDPLKRWLQDNIDRVFYRERRNYQLALLEFAQELPRLIDVDQILKSMVHRIAGTMHIDRIAVILCDEREGCASVEMNIPPACCQFTPTPGGLLEALRRSRKAQSFALLADEPDAVNLDQADKLALIRGGVVLSVPMFLQDRLIGLINVGPKRSGKVYSQEDIDLLMTVGAQAAVAIENARLHASEREKEKIKDELTMALHIQQGLLPKGVPEVPGLDIAGLSMPALTVGGDYYDFIPIDRSRMLVVVADVAGKGMSAALYMSKVQGMVQLAAHMYRSPKEMLVNVNRRIFDGIERRSFITMILALFDMKKRTVRIVRAGHNKALVGVNGTLEYLSAPGIGLGLERGPVFERELREVVRPIRPGGVFVFYTDGLTEAMDVAGRQFGEENVQRLVRSKRHLPAEQIQHHVVSAVEEFQGNAERHDDLTMVVIKAGEKRRKR